MKDYSDPVWAYITHFVQKHTKEKVMASPKIRVYTNSQKIRLRLKVYWDNNETDYDDFEEFYTAFTEDVLANLEFLVTSFQK